MAIDRVQTLIDIALEEDIGTGDITTRALFGERAIEKKGVILARQDLVIAGLEIAKRVFLTVDPDLKWERYVEEGASLKAGTKVAMIHGRYVSLLKAERTALNFLQHLSGVATLTRRFVDRVQNFSVTILDTRKTLPGYRALEKHAVRAGGGKNHRLGLYDRFLIKDNHLMGSTMIEAVQKCRENNPHKVAIEVEVDSLDQIDEALEARADIILMDNFSSKELQRAVEKVAKRAKVEASGGINLENVVAYAKTGVDFISIGALTHSAPAVDLALDIGSS